MFMRKSTRQLKVGSVLVGGGAPVSVQSMCTTRTYDVEATLGQIRALAVAGCDIVRVACPGTADADALGAIADRSPIPVIADIHFQPLYIFKAIEAGLAAVRVNPGNIRKLDDKLSEIVVAAKQNSTPLRIGINAGSLDGEILEKYQGEATAQALVEAALKEARLFEREGFEDFAISVKHHDPVVTIKAYELLSEKIDCPLHLGVTEAGPKFQGTIKSATAFGALLAQGIGDTIRVSLSDDPLEEVKVGREILMSLGLLERKLEIISCPTCGRVETDVIKLVGEVERALERYKDADIPPLKVAVMGCIVNGPGEARVADIGVAGGAGKGQIFIKGQPLKTVEQEQIIPTLLELVEQIVINDSLASAK
jgi:(E)-4-hydroxy-3-methylbut-2-enyl-diphosphate synthase